MSDRPPTVLLEVDGRGVATITLNRPERGNAYDDRMLEALNEVLGTVAADPAVRTLLLRGAGQHFLAGADIDWMSQAGLLDSRGAYLVSNLIGQTMQRLNAFPHPSIAVVQGACYGGGCGLACCADVVLATSDAVFGLTEVRAGVMPPPISSHIINAIGGRHARRFAMTGERFGAEEARRIGLVHEVIEPAGLEGRLSDVLEAISLVPPGTAAAVRASLLNASNLAQDARKIAKLAHESWSQRSISSTEAGTAPTFQERRRPGWFLSPDPEEGNT